jgi:hypothetical protein
MTPRGSIITPLPDTTLVDPSRDMHKIFTRAARATTLTTENGSDAVKYGDCMRTALVVDADTRTIAVACFGFGLFGGIARADASIGFACTAVASVLVAVFAATEALCAFATYADCLLGGVPGNNIYATVINTSAVILIIVDNAENFIIIVDCTTLYA